jgi:hypothetical protein
MDKKEIPGRVERLVRALLLLAASLTFSAAAWAAGLYRLQDPVWLYGMMGGVIVAALLVSRFGARLIVRRLPGRSSPP